MPLNTGSVDYMAALWLVLDEPARLDTLPRSWWRRSGRGIFSESYVRTRRMNLKNRRFCFFGALCACAPAEVRHESGSTGNGQLERIHVHC